MHSQLDAAAYLEEQFNSFMTCELRRQFTVEPHAAILRALLLLACSPTQVPGRVVRMLRGIYESRKKREQQQQRQAGEQAQDRKILMELELQQAWPVWGGVTGQHPSAHRLHHHDSSCIIMPSHGRFSGPQLSIALPGEKTETADQVADNACEEWEEAWSIADLVMDETVSPLQ